MPDLCLFFVQPMMDCLHRVYGFLSEVIIVILLPVAMFHCVLRLLTVHIDSWLFI